MSDTEQSPVEPIPTDDTAPAVEAETVVATATVVAPAEEPEATPVVATAPPLRVDARNPLWTVGRRKAASARIRMFPGGGNFIINGKQIDDFFRLTADRRGATEPLDRAGVRDKYDVWVNVHGGGTSGQSGAIALGVARGVIQLERQTEQQLRDAGLLSRDARVKERKKYGRRGARRGFQFSKR